MDVVIIEDDLAAQTKLVEILSSLDSNIKIHAILDSVEDAILWFSENKCPDLIFSDVQLSDGLCFDIFDKLEIGSPVIFTSGYDNYAIKAFKSNGIEYLLKPITELEVKNSIDKYNSYSGKHKVVDKELLAALVQQLRKPLPEYKKRFLIKHKQSLKIIPTNKISYFYIDNQITYLRTFDGCTYIIGYNLNYIENLLDPNDFFRFNRQIIVNLQAVNSIHDYFSDSLRIKLKPEFENELVIKRPKLSEFKSWLDR